MNLRRIFFPLLAFTCIQTVHAAVYFVSPSGDDASAGTQNAPFATLQRARDAVRALNNINSGSGVTNVVWLRAGVYELASTLELDQRDSGSAGNPVSYVAWPGEAVRLAGGASIDPSWLSKVTETNPIWDRLDAGAKGNVYEVNLRLHGIGDFGTFKPRGFSETGSSPMELSIDGQPMILGRWPNRSELMARVSASASPTQITYEGSRPSRWTKATDIWMQGLWAQSWADFHLSVASITPANSTISFATPPAQYGIAAGQPYYTYNLLEEIDEPGEYYLDRTTGNLYLWPRASLSNASLQVSRLEQPLVHMNGSSYVTFQDLVFESVRGTLVSVEGGDHVRFEHCVLRNAGTSGAVINGRENGLDRCEVVDCGEEGVRLLGGDRATLTAGGNYVTNSRIARSGRISWAYHPGVSLDSGCGNEVSHNLFEDMPHAAIVFSGNNHLVSSNEIRQVCTLTGDAGAIYTSRGWATRGTSIKDNFLHGLHSTATGGVHGVYLDDCASGIEVSGNIFYDIQNTAVFCGGGRDVIVRNNIMAACGGAHFNDDRGRQRIDNNPGSYWNLLERLSDEGVRYQQNPWAAVFPECAAIPSSWSQIQDGKWRNPENCVFANNVGWNDASWALENNSSGTGVFSLYAAFNDNEADVAPLFTASAADDRTLRSAVLTASLASFIPIPFADIGPDQGVEIRRVPPPSALLSSATLLGDEATLNWSAGSHLGRDTEVGFELHRKVETNGSWDVVAKVNATVFAAHVSHLAPNITYLFRVRAFNEAGESFSNVISFHTPPSQADLGSPIRVEAETGTVVADVGDNGSVGPSDANLDSGESVRLYDEGDTVRIAIDVPTAGPYQLGVRVRAGGSTGPTVFWPGGYRFLLDGVAVSLTGDPTTLSSYDSSYGGCFWGTMLGTPFALSAGRHFVDVSAATTWAVADYVELTPLSVAMPPLGAPTISVPGDIMTEATSNSGAPVTFSFSAHDSGGGDLTAVSSPASGSIFPIGTTHVTVTATDAGGASSSLAFQVTVRDTMAPTLTLPSNLVFEADGPDGSVATFSTSAVDLVSGIVVPVALPSSGSKFPIGSTFVNVKAVDTSGNLATGRFSILVRDTTPPSLTAPANMIVASTDPSGATLTFAATAVDTVNGNCPVEFRPAAGSHFNPGSTAVIVTSTDKAGNVAMKSFVVTVTDYHLGTPTLTAAPSSGGIALAWSKVDYASSYDVRRSSERNGPFQTLARVSGQTFFTDTSAPTNTAYYYTVNAVNGDLTGSDSAVTTSIWSNRIPGWDETDIGTVNAAGSSQLDGTTFSVTGAGSDIWGTADSFHFVFQSFSGDGVLTTRVGSIDYTDSWAKAGIMVRESLRPDSRFVAVYLTPGNGVAFQYRSVTGGDCGHIGGLGSSSPQWLRLVRSANVIAAYQSPDATNWTKIGSVEIALPVDVHAGLAVTSHNPAASCRALFDAVAKDALSPPPDQPSPTPTPTPDPSQPALSEPIRIEVEGNAAVMVDNHSNGTVGVSDASLDSGESVRLYDEGDRIRVPFAVPSAGNYELRVRLRAGGTTGSTGYWPNGYAFSLDGVGLTLTSDPQTLSAFDPAYGGCYWGTMSVSSVSLNAGMHALDIEARSTWAVADYIEVVRK